ncbi:hypothetical protein Halha_1087 [Halobacteroides halobius DSM 5150]|uniref:Uncharacterized protein n=1 Tax=Halobacteroides halobius (strain ATCC 35273 / DSM 5150 / MD-1) TaxID=748449 RepID=L0K7P2_HALHC|nr:hypothetical protein [Halobacteroides halobius]AGB41041.1 hypothetical protein Halha_1087 [Halobacteroides halobius DSM 5150]
MLAEDTIEDVLEGQETSGQTTIKNPNLEVDLGSKKVFQRKKERLDKESNIVEEISKLNERSSSAVKFVNYTSHPIRVVNEEGDLVLSLEPAKRAVRVKTRMEDVVDVAGVPIATKTTRRVNKLPPPKPGVLYVVSGYVKNVLSHRSDLVVPDISSKSIIRDENGEVEAVRRLSR